MADATNVFGDPITSANAAPPASPAAPQVNVFGDPVQQGGIVTQQELRYPQQQASPLSTAGGGSSTAPYGSGFPYVPPVVTLPDFLDRSMGAIFPDVAKQNADTVQSYTKKNTAPDGTPLDINAGLNVPGASNGLTQGVVNSTYRDISDAYYDLFNKFGNARVTQSGDNVIVRQPGPDGKPVDVLAFPYGGFLSHPAQSIGASLIPAAETAGKLAAATLTANPEIAAAPIFGQTLGPATALALRGANALASPAEDIEEGKGKAAAALDLAGNVVGPLATEFAPLAARRLMIPAATKPLTELANAAFDGQAIDAPTSAIAGSPTIARMENAPGAAAAVGGAQNTALQTSLLGAQRRALDGNAPGLLDSQATIAGAVKPVLAAQDAAAQGAVQLQVNAAQRDALNAIQQQTGSTATNADVGRQVREAIANRKADFADTNQTNYNSLYDLAEQHRVTVDPQPAAKAVLGQLTQEIPEIAAGVAPGLGRAVATAGQLSEAEPLSLQQAITARAAIRNNLDSGVYVGELENQKWSRVAQALDTSIKQAVASAPKPVQDAYALANDTYAQGVGNFNNADVARLAQEPTSGGFVADHEIVPSLLQGGGNTDALNNYKNTLGANSPEYGALKSQLVQHTVNGAGDPSKVADAIGALNPDFAKEIFGAQLGEQQANATLAKAVGGGTVADADLQAALTNASPLVAARARTALAAQTAYQQKYQAGILKQLRDGTVDPATVSRNPDLFVQNFVSSASADDMTKVLAALPEDQQVQIARSTLQKIVDDSAVLPNADGTPSGRLNPDKIAGFLKGPDAAKYAAALAPLGPQATQFLQDMIPANRQLALRDAAQAAPGATVRKTLGFSALGAGAGYGLFRSPGAAEAGALAGAAFEAAPTIGTTVAGNAMRLQHVRDFLATGKLPDFQPAVSALPGVAAAALSVRRPLDRPALIQPTVAGAVPYVPPPPAAAP